MAKLITVYWRDIPSQVIAKRGRETVKVALPERFQVAIDRAAMRAGKGSSDLYLAEWRRESRTCAGALEDAARAESVRLDAAWTDEELERVTKAGGLGGARTEGGQ